MAGNTLYYGDNLAVLKRHVKDESIDLVYLDPPFNSNATYNVLFREHDHTPAPSQIEAFGDTWRWDQAAAEAYQHVVEQGGRVADALQAFRTFIPESDMLAYLAMMAPRLQELYRVLKPTGSIYLHCDPTASHYLKLLMDAVFGPEHLQNEVIWYYRGGGVSKSRFGRRHDVLLFYTKGSGWTFNVDAVRTPYSKDSEERLKYKAKAFRGDKVYDAYEQNPLGKHPDDVWEIQPIMPSAKQRLGYPTQKPEALLERVIKASSNEGDVVLDPFCGCGTTVAVAQRLGRSWIGIDLTHLAIGLIKVRLQDAHELVAVNDYDVVGEPTDLPGARELAAENPWQFQAWALGLVGARTATSAKKGSDKGIDGRILFHDDEGAGAKTKQIILSVKAGHTNVAHVRDLVGVLQREGAQIGVLLTMNQPTQPMRAEAASAGFYTSPWGGTHPRIQLITVEDALEGKKIDYPSHATTTFKAAPKVEEDEGPPQEEQLFDLG